ncbi:hypothetical protein DEHRE_10995 [Dehalobacter restrictus DSM 9455]|uniref:GGDEF domain-containing protein n=1 Tax=Dehalobacter restrictus (strain DSM 9455 / PER-K23) TaxID=871738 RepID=A0ABM5P9M1_DEHRP|nr:hypothetical protein DEHRE_10995 [Dehalobacter restrictus DSM 9455]
MDIFVFTCYSLFLIQKMDNKLYLAKKNGRDRVEA